jgi:inward rectifier potassium channel
MPRYFERFKNRFINNTGFDDQIGDVGDRILSKDGKGNVSKRGLHRLKHLSLFHTLIDLNIWFFWLVCFIGFVVINLVFGSVYYFCGADFLLINPALSESDRLLECFYFSCQTLTAVGYGHLAPTSNLVSTIASFQAFFGLMSFAVITGLLYARFSKPRAYLKFSKQAIIRPFREGKALMFRLATYKNNDLTDVTCKVVAAFAQTKNGITTNRFIPLDLEIDTIQELVLNWTVVHVIDEKSPFYEMTKEDIDAAKVEIIILVKGYDEYFATNVQERTSYIWEEFCYNVRFVKMFHRSENNKKTILDIDKLSKTESCN